MDIVAPYLKKMAAARTNISKHFQCNRMFFAYFEFTVGPFKSWFLSYKFSVQGNMKDFALTMNE